MSRPIPLLVLGLGNVLLSDDGLGAAAVNDLLRRFEVPDGATVLDGGTLGMSLLPYLEDADAAILVDAVRAEAAPGSPVRLEGEDVAPAVAGRLSPHQVGVADLLDGARLLDRYPRRVVLLGLVPASLGLGLGRSPAVEARVPGLVDRIVEEAHDLGFDFVAKSEPEADRGAGADRAARALGL
jgi:hydrogenase maturation protease